MSVLAPALGSVTIPEDLGPLCSLYKDFKHLENLQDYMEKYLILKTLKFSVPVKRGLQSIALWYWVSTDLESDMVTMLPPFWIPRVPWLKMWVILKCRLFLKIITRAP